MRNILAATIVACFAISGLPRQAGAITFGQTDTFQDGTLQNWGPSGVSPMNVSTGGPAGAGDRYYQFTSTGTGTVGSHLATYNYQHQWAGNYLTAGVNRVDVDLKNPSSSTLYIRAVIFDPFFNNAGAGEQWTSSIPAVLPADGGIWHHFRFSLLEPDMLHSFGTASYASTFGNVARLMFRHDTVGSDDGDVIAASLGLDNVTAVPEPSAIAILLIGIPLAGTRRRRA
jgi:hypothetical protein